ncbi:prepilin peptidase [Microbacterium sorbitolivorans]|uniref:Prepilin peptidase n=1 Tax=Microbacterium sorbitolivorans TaxID=1867410 RepID=A0A367Y6F5_9MICO|nr:A24 family peptidase [Microbacterium sorbitolivorans]RCK61219.1 prepilin peptidase [Microbacterium sorbitolivorans]GGF34016.1 prepilin peptidase [Microbacterium sorbitolivorans]
MSHALMIVAQVGFVVVGAWLTHVDIREHRIPNRIVAPLAGGMLVLCAADAAASESLEPLARGVAGALVLGSVYAILRAASRGALGGGDVKLAVPTGMLLAWEGWIPLLAGGGLAFLIGGVWSIGILVSRRGNAATAVAFGPFIVLGAVTGLAIT